MRAALVIVLCAACGAGAASDDAPDALDVDAPAPLGSWENPIVITGVPFTVTGDTTTSTERRAGRYDCLYDAAEDGAEVVYRLDLPASQLVALRLTGVAAGADVDLHVLRGSAMPLPGGLVGNCLARDDTALVIDLAAGSWLVAVDTFTGPVDGEQPGAFTLTGEAPASTACLTNPIPECEAGDMPDVNGNPEEPPGLDGCPPGMARAGSVCMDRWEAALVLDFLRGTGSWSPYENPGDEPYRAISAPGLVPQGYISGTQAAAACMRAGKRLCTDDEWLRACQGAAGTTYPYGNAREAGRCNDARTCHPAVQYFESSDASVFSMLDHPCLDQLPDGLARTGVHAGCASSEGIFDLMGNLHEWTADPAGTFRGGFFVDTAINGDGCLYRTTAHDSGHWDYSTGFRCCRDAP